MSGPIDRHYHTLHGFEESGDFIHVFLFSDAVSTKRMQELVREISGSETAEASDFLGNQYLKIAKSERHLIPYVVDAGLDALRRIALPQPPTRKGHPNDIYAGTYVNDDIIRPGAPIDEVHVTPEGHVFVGEVGVRYSVADRLEYATMQIPSGVTLCTTPGPKYHCGEHFSLRQSELNIIRDHRDRCNMYRLSIQLSAAKNLIMGRSTTPHTMFRQDCWSTLEGRLYARELCDSHPTRGMEDDVIDASMFTAANREKLSDRDDNPRIDYPRFED